MPTIIGERDYVKVQVNLKRSACQFAFNIEDGKVAYGFIHFRKFKKHILPVDLRKAETAEAAREWQLWGVIEPDDEGSGHTAITPASFGAIRPLYEVFAKDFIRVFREDGEKDQSVSLRYSKQELGKSVPGGIDVRNNGSECDFHFVEIGAIVRYMSAGDVRQSATREQLKTGNILIVFFQHGPYPVPV